MAFGVLSGGDKKQNTTTVTTNVADSYNSATSINSSIDNTGNVSLAFGEDMGGSAQTQSTIIIVAFAGVLIFGALWLLKEG